MIHRAFLCAILPALVVLLTILRPTSGDPTPAPASAPPSGRTIAITIDDLPLAPNADDLATVKRINEALVGLLARRRVPAIGFVNEGKLQVTGERDARIAVLSSWLDAGLSLGNHTFSHSSLRDIPLPAYEDDVIHGEVITRQLLAQRGGSPTLYFRHPYTATGPTAEIKEAFETFLHARGYVIAPFTVENSDYIFNRILIEALKRNDTDEAACTRAAYLDHTDAVITFCEGLARDTFGRDIPQILLIHDSELNAGVLGDLLDRLSARGYSFVSLDEALRDAAYRTPDRYVGRVGPSWLHRWRVGLGLPSRLRDEPDPPQWVLERYRVVTARG
jgi:peptidoglycan/xylan/chitin deacetylase (PgdA/CDA1 family)